MENGIIIKSFNASRTLKGSDIISLGADTLIVKKKNSLISVNPQSGSEYVAYTFNDEISIQSTDKILFKEPTPVVLAKKGNITSLSDASFSLKSNTTIVCPDITSSKELASDFQEIQETRGFEIVNGTVKNISGRTLTMYGSLEVKYKQTGGQPATFHLASETSMDGVTWTPNTQSYRSVYVTKNGEDILNIDSLNEQDWQDGQYIRWIFGKTGTGGIEISQPSIVWDGQTIYGRALLWTMKERIRSI